ncbi:MAG: hypothetical protein VXV94_00990, partial [Cyanobacteriota bacterium]|nr:hypothetical protein [Cyanobacteriota bacterium]
ATSRDVRGVTISYRSSRAFSRVHTPLAATSRFSLPIDCMCLTISRDLLDLATEHVQHLKSSDPVRWT